MSSFAVFCSGQGAQAPDLFRRFPFTEKGLALQRQAIDSASLQPEVAAWLADPAAPPDLLFQNRFSQPLIALYQAMIWAELKDSLPAPAMVAGYSLGELSAYACAGAIAPVEIVRLAGIRAALMDAASKGGRLIAVPGFPVASAERLAAQAGGHVAITVSDDHCVVGCPAGQAEKLAADLRGAGARNTVLLAVSVASHTPLLDSAVEPFREALRKVTWASPQTAIIAGISASKVLRREQMEQSLPEQIHRTVRWDLVQQRVLESGCTTILELGPGAQLARMIAPRGVQARSVEEFRSAEGVVRWVEKAVGRG